MKVTVATEARLVRASDGAVYSTTGGRAYSFWKRYLEVFESVTVLARVDERLLAAPTGAAVEGPGVHVHALPNYHGLAGFAARLPGIWAEIRRLASEPKGAYLVRMPSALGGLLAEAANAAGSPFGVEVVGDPKGVFTSGVGGVAAKPLATFSAAHLRRVCNRATAVSYVTRSYLQQNYPPGESAASAAISDVDLPETAFVTEPRRHQPGMKFNLITVGSLAQRYKGVDTLIESVAYLRSRNLDVHLAVVGDGKHRTELERQAESTGVERYVHFLGHRASAAAVRTELDEADLFVLASRTEGLPRALLEAMARALPAVATQVGGIPELLDPANMVKPQSSIDLANAIQRLLKDPVELDNQSRRNLEIAKAYAESKLTSERETFYRALRSRSDSGAGPR